MAANPAVGWCRGGAMSRRKSAARHAQWADWHDADTPWRHDAKRHAVYSRCLATTARRAPLRHRRRASAESWRHGGPVTSQDAEWRHRRDQLTSSGPSQRAWRWAIDCRRAALWRRAWHAGELCDYDCCVCNATTTIIIIIIIIIMLSNRCLFL